MSLEVRAEFVEGGPAGVAVDHDPVAGRTPEQLVHGKPGDLALDVPQRDVDRSDGGHRHRPAPPIGAPVEVLPGVLDPARIAADEQWADVIPQVGGDGELAAIQGRVAEPDHPVLGLDDQGDVVAAG